MRYSLFELITYVLLSVVAMCLTFYSYFMYVDFVEEEKVVKSEATELLETKGNNVRFEVVEKQKVKRATVDERTYLIHYKNGVIKNIVLEETKQEE